MIELDAFFNSLADILESLRCQRELPSLSAAVALEGEVVWQGDCGLATLAPPRPAAPEMVYPIGSITKVLDSGEN